MQRLITYFKRGFCAIMCMAVLPLFPAFACKSNEFTYIDSTTNEEKCIVDKFQAELDITNANYKTVSILLTATGTFYINWGDNTATEKYTNSANTTITHPYGSTGSYTIHFGSENVTAYSTSYAAISFSQTTATKSDLVGISGSLGELFPTLSNNTQPLFKAAFYGCNKLTGPLPANLFGGLSGNMTSSDMFKQTFYSCSSLGKNGSTANAYYVPPAFFGGLNIDTTKMSNMFYGTSLMTSCPTAVGKTNVGTTLVNSKVMCKCADGQYATAFDASACESCADGLITNSTGDGCVFNCPTGYTDNPNATQTSECYKTTNPSCATCSIDHGTCQYQNQSNNATCAEYYGGTESCDYTACGTKTVTCDTDYVISNGVCTACPTNSHSNDSATCVCDGEYEWKDQNHTICGLKVTCPDVHQVGQDCHCDTGWEADPNDSDVCVVIPYVIAYELYGGTNGSGNPLTYNVDTSDIKLVNPTKSGHNFIGWCVYGASETDYGTDCDSTTHSSNYIAPQDTQSTIVAIPTNSTGNKTVYAKWTVKTIQCSGGYYIDANSEQCNTPCPVDYYCPVASYNFTGTAQGKIACVDIPGSNGEYTNSAGGTTSNAAGACYKTTNPSCATCSIDHGTCQYQNQSNNATCTEYYGETESCDYTACGTKTVTSCDTDYIETDGNCVALCPDHAVYDSEQHTCVCNMPYTMNALQTACELVCPDDSTLSGSVCVCNNSNYTWNASSNKCKYNQCDDNKHEIVNAQNNGCKCPAFFVRDSNNVCVLSCPTDYSHENDTHDGCVCETGYSSDEVVIDSSVSITDAFPQRVGGKYRSFWDGSSCSNTVPHNSNTYNDLGLSGIYNASNICTGLGLSADEFYVGFRDTSGNNKGGSLWGTAWCDEKNAGATVTKAAAGTPSMRPGNACWCRLDKFRKQGDTVIKPVYVWAQIYPPMSSCSSQCVEYCADGFANVNGDTTNLRSVIYEAAVLPHCVKDCPAGTTVDALNGECILNTCPVDSIKSGDNCVCKAASTYNQTYNPDTNVCECERGYNKNETDPANTTCEKADYNITYNLYGGTNGFGNPLTYNVDTSDIKLVNPTKSGHNFIGWCVYGASETDYGTDCDSTTHSSNYIAPQDTQSTIVAIPTNSIGNKTVYAKWELAEYSFIYHEKGGHCKDANNNDVTCTPLQYNTSDSSVSLPVAGKDGHDFAGWCTTDSDSCTVLPNNEFVPNPNNPGDVDLYAKWTPHVITLNYTSVRGNPQSSSCVYGETFTVAPALTAGGYTFNKWTVNSNDFTAGQTGVVCNYSTLGVYSGSVNITAVWDNNLYTFVLRNPHTGYLDEGEICQYFDTAEYASINDIPAIVQDHYGSYMDSTCNLTYSGMSEPFDEATEIIVSWNTSSSGSGISLAMVNEPWYNNSNINAITAIADSSLAPDYTVDLYAQWGQCTANNETPVLDTNNNTEYKVDMTNGRITVSTLNNNCQYTISCNPGYEIANNPCNATGMTWNANNQTCTNSNLTLNATIADCTPVVYDITLNNYLGIPETDHIYEKYNTGWFWFQDASAETAISSQLVPSTDGFIFRGYYAEPQTYVSSNTSCTATEISAGTCSVPVPDISRASNYDSGGSDAGHVVSLPSPATTYSADTQLHAAWAIKCATIDDENYDSHAHCTLNVDTNGYVTYTTWCDESYTLVPETSGTYNPQCSADIYTITLDATTNGGVPNYTLYEVYGERWYLSPADDCPMADGDTVLQCLPLRESAVFTGYWTAQTGGIKVIDDDGSMLVPNTQFTSDTTLYAHFDTCTPPTGIANIGNWTTWVNETNQCEWNAFCADGYTSSKMVTIGGVTAPGVQVLSEAGTTTVDTIEGSCQPKTIQLNFYKELADIISGSKYVEDSCTFNETNGLTVPNNPTKTGHTFMGWEIYSVPSGS